MKDTGIELEELTANVSFKQSGGFFQESTFSQHIDVSFHKEYDTEENIGTAAFLYFNGTYTNHDSMREIADDFGDHLFQSISSVRVYSSQQHAESDKSMGFQMDKRTDTFLIFDSFPFHEETESVWGRIIVLDDISLSNDLNTLPIFTTLFNNMIAAFVNLGIEWIIINTNEDFSAHPFQTRVSFNEFLSNIGFKKSYGRTANNDFSYCYHLQKNEVVSFSTTRKQA